MSVKKTTGKTSDLTINAGIVGFGLSGKIFHAPFIEAHPDFKLHTIVSSGKDAAALYPEALAVNNYNALLANPEIDLVVICTPHQFHANQAMQALNAGKHVVIEKPVAMSSSDVELLIETTNSTGKMFFPYHNRRWDGDFLTLKHIIRQGYLGDILEFESHFDRWSPTLSRAEWRYNNTEGGGMLFDLGPHLIDQVISLFGLPDAVWCMLYIQRDESMVNDSFDLKLIYPGMTATLKAGVFVMEAGPRFQVHGTKGSYVKHGIDPQEAMLKKGLKPKGKRFGVEPKKYSGLLHSKSDNKTIRVRYETMPGNYLGFYQNVFEAVTDGAKPEVTASDALITIKIIEAAMKSHKEKRHVEVEP